MTWSVRGIDDEAREAALVAARRSGKSVGEWLNAAIREQATRAPDPASSLPNDPGRAAFAAREPVEERLAALADRLARLAARSAPDPRPDRVTLDEVALELDRHLDRPEPRWEPPVPGGQGVRMGRAIADLERRVRELQERTVAERPAPPRAAPAPSVSIGMLDAAIADIRRRQRMLEPGMDGREFRQAAEPARVVPPPADVDRHFRELADRLDVLGSRPPAVSADDLDDLRQGLRRIEDRLTDMPVDPGRGIVDELEHLRGEVAALASARSLETIAAGQARLAERIERMPAPVVSPAELSAILDELAGLRKELDLRPIASNLSGIEHKLATLGHRLDQLVARGQQGAPLDEVMREELQRIVNSGTIERLDHRVADMAERLDKVVAGGGQTKALERLAADVAQLVDVVETMRQGAPRPEDDRIGSVLDGLDAIGQRLDVLEQSRHSVRELGPADASEAALNALAGQIEDLGRRFDGIGGVGDADLVRRLDAISGQLDAAEARFTTLDGLSDTLTEIRALVAGHADDAGSARAAAREAVAEFANLARETGPGEALAELVAELKELRETSRGLEQRTVEGLRSVQDALTAILPHFSVRAPAEGADTAHGERRSGGERRKVAASDEARPLEPGSGRPVSVVATAAPEAEFIREPGATQAPTNSRRADFIAAARRAAQAAQSVQAQLPAGEAAVALDAADPDAPAKPSALARIGAALRGRSKPVAMLAAAVILAAMVAELPVGTWDRIVRATRPQAPEVATTAVEPSGDVVGAIPPQSAPEASAPKPDAPAVSVTAPPEGPTTRFSDRPLGAPAGFQPSAPTLAARLDPAGADPVVTRAVPAATGAAAVATAQPSAPGGADAWPMPPEKVGPQALRQAASQGDVKAAFEIGLRFAEGRGIPQDGKLALEWYRRAAQKGFVPAQYRLASGYEKGLAGTRDTAEAKRWYQMAAEAGSVRAMHNLGVLNANDRDMANALPWFQKAADLGLKDSQFNLGIIYALGSGVKQDLAVSYKWFTLAADQGDPEAAKKRDDIAQYLDRPTLAAAKMAAQTWRARSVDRAANDETTGWSDSVASAPSATAGGDQVSRVQTLLKAQGLYSGPVDGQASPAVRTAVKAAQKKAGLKQTGEIDDALVRALTSPRAG